MNIGFVEECAEYLARKNNEFENEMKTLKSIKGRVKAEAKGIHFSVGKLSLVCVIGSINSKDLHC